MKIHERSADLSTGVTLRYVEQGDPAGLPMLMLHGVTDSWRSFEPVLEHLPASVRVFAVSQRGHGDSSRPASGYRTRDFAADVAAFADAMHLPQVLVVGHSMGGTNALRFAVDHPERVLGLVIAGSFFAYSDNTVVREFWQSGVLPLTDPIEAAFAREFQESTLAQPIAEGFLDAVVGESLKAPARVWRDAFAGMMEDDCVAELAAIAAPTLILWGARDALSRRSDQQALLEAIPGARLTVYESAGHGLHWEEPQRFAADLAAFAEMCSERATEVGAAV